MNEHKKISQSKQENSVSREAVLQYAKDARKLLNYYLGVDDLTTIESVRLNHIVEQCLTLKREQGELADFSIAGESAWRWLYDLYGIRWEDIPRDFKIFDGKISIK